MTAPLNTDPAANPGAELGDEVVAPVAAGKAVVGLLAPAELRLELELELELPVPVPDAAEPPVTALYNVSGSSRTEEFGS